MFTRPFTEEEITKAATVLKMFRLALMPGMDRAAVMLNREPTYEELKSVAEVSMVLRMVREFPEEKDLDLLARYIKERKP